MKNQPHVKFLSQKEWIFVFLWKNSEQTFENSSKFKTELRVLLVSSEWLSSGTHWDRDGMIVYT